VSSLGLKRVRDVREAGLHEMGVDGKTTAWRCRGEAGLRMCVCVYVYLYLCVCVYVCVFMCVFMYLCGPA
jgi:hypothetical protein